MNSASRAALSRHQCQQVRLQEHFVFLKSCSLETQSQWQLAVSSYSPSDISTGVTLDTIMLGQGNWLLNRFCHLNSSLETSTLVTGTELQVYILDTEPAQFCIAFYKHSYLDVATSQPTGVFWQQNKHRNLKEIVRSWIRLLEQLFQDINASKSDCRSILYNEQTLFFRGLPKSNS